MKTTADRCFESTVDRDAVDRATPSIAIASIAIARPRSIARRRRRRRPSTRPSGH